MLDMIAEVAPLARAVCSDGYDAAVRLLCDELPFRVIAVPGDTEHNGWVIPPRWDVAEAKILREGTVVYDGKAHPLGVIALSRSFEGTVHREELRQHLHYDPRYPDALPYHYRQQFRSWERDWGLCVPKTFYDSLQPGGYEVILRTDEGPGELRILEYTQAGAIDSTIILGGNLDHAGVANDGIAGCAVGIEVMRRLRGRRTRFTYKLVLSPGILGSEFYLAGLTGDDRSRILEGVFLEMLGSSTPLVLQESRRPLVSLSQALRSALRRSGADHRIYPFAHQLVNDEYLWENYGIPMLSLSRFPYPEYHSSLDSVDRIRPGALAEAADVLLQAIEQIESSPLLIKRFQGNLCLSHPQYDLYVDAGQVALGDAPSEKRSRMRRLMDLVPSLDRPVSVAGLAEMVGLPLADTLAYLERWQQKGLIELL